MDSNLDSRMGFRTRYICKLRKTSASEYASDRRIKMPPLLTPQCLMLKPYELEHIEAIVIRGVPQS